MFGLFSTIGKLYEHPFDIRADLPNLVGSMNTVSGFGFRLRPTPRPGPARRQLPGSLVAAGAYDSIPARAYCFPSVNAGITSRP